MSEELKPCPFCGGEAEIYSDQFQIWVECESCGAKSDTANTKKDAIAVWNQRVDYIGDVNEKVNSAWIPCSERLPEIYKMVIVYTCDKHITMAYMERSEMWHEFKAETGLSCGHMWATYWQPLPEPPED